MESADKPMTATEVQERIRAHGEYHQKRINEKLSPLFAPMLERYKRILVRKGLISDEANN